MTLLEAYNFPFAVSAMLLVFIALLQLLGAGDLFDGGDVDVSVDMDAADGLSNVGPADGLMSILGIGRVPFLIWLVMLMMLFTVIGAAGQQVLIAAIGQPLPPLLAALAAGAAALPLNGIVTRPLARLLPQDETTAVGLASLVRRDAEIQVGTARAGSPARAKVMDVHGQPHFVMVEPHNPDEELAQGETVLLVRRDGERFYAMRYQNPMLSID